MVLPFATPNSNHNVLGLCCNFKCSNTYLSGYVLTFGIF